MGLRNYTQTGPPRPPKRKSRKDVEFDTAAETTDHDDITFSRMTSLRVRLVRDSCFDEYDDDEEEEDSLLQLYLEDAERDSRDERPYRDDEEFEENDTYSTSSRSSKLSRRRREPSDTVQDSIDSPEVILQAVEMIDNLFRTLDGSSSRRMTRTRRKNLTFDEEDTMDDAMDQEPALHGARRCHDAMLADARMIEGRNRTFSWMDAPSASQDQQSDESDGVDKEEEDTIFGDIEDGDRVPSRFSALFDVTHAKQKLDQARERVKDNEVVKTVCLHEDEVGEFFSFLAQHQESNLQEMCGNFDRAHVIQDLRETICNVVRFPLGHPKDCRLPIQVYHEKFTPADLSESSGRQKKKKTFLRRIGRWLWKRLRRRKGRRSGGDERTCAETTPSLQVRWFRAKKQRHAKVWSKGMMQTRRDDASAEDDGTGATSCKSLGELQSGDGKEEPVEYLQVVIEVDQDGSDERNNSRDGGRCCDATMPKAEV